MIILKFLKLLFINNIIMSQSKVAEVILVKKFTYPKGALISERPFEEAVNLSLEEFLTEIKESTNNLKNPLNKNNFIISTGFTSDYVKDSQNIYGSFGYKRMMVCTAITKVVNYLFETKYGPLDPQRNPKIFEVEDSNLEKEKKPAPAKQAAGEGMIALEVNPFEDPVPGERPVEDLEAFARRIVIRTRSSSKTKEDQTTKTVKKLNKEYRKYYDDLCNEIYDAMSR